MLKLRVYMVLFTVFVFSSVSRGRTDPQDVYALKILYESLKSPQQLSRWTSKGGDPCGDLWQGVECSGRNVISIRLPGLRLRGSMGDSLNKFSSLLILDLSNNHIGEMIPFQLPPRIVQLLLGNNVLIGSIPYSTKRLMQMTNLNLSTNFLSGELPDIFGRLPNLQTLDISNNNFTGELPPTMSTLTSLANLHIQQNELSGSLEVLESLPLKDLNIENNNFSGSLPPKLASVPILRAGGNRHLTGVPASSGNGAPNMAQPFHSSRPHEPIIEGGAGSITGSKLAGIIAGGIAGALCFTLILFMVLNKPCVNQAPQPADNDSGSTPARPVVPPGTPGKASTDEISVVSSPERRTLKPLPAERYKPPVDKHVDKTSNLSVSAPAYTFLELQAATSNFSRDNLVGEGLMGTVYRGVFASGRTVAVKKLEPSAFSTRKEDDILATIGSISRLHHGNIVELVGYCADNGNYLLVYPYFPKGALHDLMHGRNGGPKRYHISWNERVRVALGSARALEYLHEVCVPATVHRNFKSSNVLLDEELNAYVSDCGLAALVPFSIERQISAQTLSAFGYSAPEYAMSGVYTTKSDVYSFGVFMLELLTGREPLDSLRPRGREHSLVSWAAPKLYDIDQLSKITDPSLEGMYPAKALIKFAEIITQCIQLEASIRPSMSEVVQSLTRLMQRGSKTTTTATELQDDETKMPHEAPSQRRFRGHSKLGDAIKLSL